MIITECNNNLNAAVKIPNTFTFSDGAFTVIGLGGFSGHDKLELVQLPNTLTELLASAFSECRNLSEINLPESLRVINTRALQSCVKLKEIYIPANTTSISDAAFAECRNLEKFVVATDNPRYATVQDHLVDIQNNKLVQGIAKILNVEIPDSITSLGQYCFASMPIESVRIPDSITTVSSNAFSRCTSLKAVTLPNTLKVLDATCFAWCDNLTNILLPETLTDIMTYVFNSCALSEVTIPASVNNVLDRSFGDMKTLNKVIFKKALNPDGSIKMPNIHFSAFAGSGDTNTPVCFYLPWSETEHYAKYAEGLTENGVEKDPAFGAANYIFYFNAEEAN